MPTYTLLAGRLLTAVDNSAAAVIISIGFIIQMTSNLTDAWEQIMMGRFVSGLGVGALSANVPIYQVRSVVVPSCLTPDR